MRLERLIFDERGYARFENELQKINEIGAVSEN